MLSGNELERGVKPGLEVDDEGAGGLMARLWLEEGAGGDLSAMMMYHHNVSHFVEYGLCSAALHKM